MCSHFILLVYIVLCVCFFLNFNLCGLCMCVSFLNTWWDWVSLTLGVLYDMSGLKYLCLESPSFLSLKRENPGSHFCYLLFSFIFIIFYLVFLRVVCLINIFYRIFIFILVSYNNRSYLFNFFLYNIFERFLVQFSVQLSRDDEAIFSDNLHR